MIPTKDRHNKHHVVPQGPSAFNAVPTVARKRPTKQHVFDAGAMAAGVPERGEEALVPLGNVFVGGFDDSKRYYTNYGVDIAHQTYETATGIVEQAHDTIGGYVQGPVDQTKNRYYAARQQSQSWLSWAADQPGRLLQWAGDTQSGMVKVLRWVLIAAVTIAALRALTAGLGLAKLSRGRRTARRRLKRNPYGGYNEPGLGDPGVALRSEPPSSSATPKRKGFFRRTTAVVREEADANRVYVARALGTIVGLGLIMTGYGVLIGIGLILFSLVPSEEAISRTVSGVVGDAAALDARKGVKRGFTRKRRRASAKARKKKKAKASKDGQKEKKKGLFSWGSAS